VKPLPCKPNIEVFFSDDPQTALDDFRKKNANTLGYQGATKVSHPIEAWYETGTTDIDGHTTLDQETMGTIEFTNGGLVPSSRGGLVESGITVTNGIPHLAIDGWRARPELTSDFISVLIISDTRETAVYRLGAIADYIAVLALSQTRADETCQIVPSVMNVMAKACGEGMATKEMSASDLGYLRGVYKMDAGASLLAQEDGIAAEMAKGLGPASTRARR
jgi:hypothetical protein